MTDRSRFGPWRLVAGLLITALMLGRLPSVASAGGGGIIGRPAADFALPAVVGSNVRLSESRGQPVILSFWSSQCSSCVKQLTSLDRLYATYRAAGLVVYGISVDDNLLHAGQYAQAHIPSFPLLLDSHKDVARAMQLERLPTAVLIDRSGVVRYIHSGDDFDERAYVVQIRTLLDDNPAVP